MNGTIEIRRMFFHWYCVRKILVKGYTYFNNNDDMQSRKRNDVCGDNVLLLPSSNRNNQISAWSNYFLQRWRILFLQNLQIVFLNNFPLKSRKFSTRTANEYQEHGKLQDCFSHTHPRETKTPRNLFKTNQHMNYFLHYMPILRT